jgi:S1-C subfamily serine protease
MGPAIASMVAIGMAAAVMVGVGALTAFFGPSGSGRIETTDPATPTPVPGGGADGDDRGATALTATGFTLAGSRSSSSPETDGDGGGGGSDVATGPGGHTAGGSVTGPASQSVITGDAAGETFHAQPETVPDPTASAGDGVFALTDGTPTRLATFTVIDGIVYTSASAIDGHDELRVVVGHDLAEATVLGTDRFTDIAVLELDDAELTRLLARSSSVWPAPLPEAGQLHLGTRVRVAVPDPARAHGESLIGAVLGTDEPTPLPNGDIVYGTVTTSAHRPDGASGGPLVDDTGNLVGIVIESATYLATAVPTEEVTAIGESLHRWGWPALEWLGVEGRAVNGNEIRLIDVVAGGPADRAGLRAGDVIATIDGIEVEDWYHLVHLLRHADIGTTLTVEVERRTPGTDDEATEVINVVVGSIADRLEIALGTGATE